MRLMGYFKPNADAFKRIILGLFALALLIMLSTFSLSTWLVQQRNLDRSLDTTRHALDTSYHNAIKGQADMLAATLIAISADPRYVEPFLSQDRAALLKLAQPLYQQLRQGQDITHLYFIRTDRTVFLRGHLPNNYDDLVNRYTLRQAEQNGVVARGIELGKTGTFTLRVVMPWKHNGKLIGYIELGKELESVVEQVAGQLGSDLAVFIDKSRLKRTDWEEGMRLLNRNPDWGQFPNDVLVGSNLKVLPDEIAGHLPDWRQTNPEALEAIPTTDGKRLMLTFLPLRDAGGDVVGAIFTILDSSRQFNDIVRTLALVCGIGLFVGLLLVWIFYLILSRVERRLAEAEAERERSRQYHDRLLSVTSIIDSMGDGLLVTDGQGRITQSNPALLHLFAIQNAPPGQLCGTIFGSEVGRFVSEALDQSRLASTLSGEVELPGKHVARVMATLLGEVYPNIGQAQQGAVFTFRDTTREVEISRMKTDFIANVSHELRTPLTSVLGFAKLIRKQFSQIVIPALGEMEAKLARTVGKIEYHLDIIVSEGERLTHLINDVLDLTKIEAGKLEWREEAVNIRALVERAEASTAALFQQKGLTQTLAVADDLPEITADPDRLLQVLINLLSNAVKFTEQGGVHCAAARQNDEIVVSITDTGCGISPADQARLFERFRQVGDTLTEKPSGTGLGLAICKQIVEHYQGRIWVESQAGIGSTFSFSMPLTVADQPALTAPPQRTEVEAAVGVAPSSRSVLVVDDEAHIRELLRQELEAAGYVVREAADGMEAIRMAKSEPPDLVLLDIMMPGMNGFEVAAVLRSAPETSAIPIIILSIIEDKARGRAVGVDRYLTKPVDVDNLLGEIDNLLHQHETRKHVLVVDENDATATSLRDVLLAKGYHVEVVERGEQNMQRMQDLLPELIVVAGSAERSAQVVASMQMARNQEHAVLIVTEKSSGGDTHD